MNDDKIVHKIV